MSFVQSKTQTAPQGIGKAVPRKEDERLLQGKGCYGDDFNLSGQAYAIMVRSPHAHARIGSIDASEALATPGVIAVLTGRDAKQDGLKPFPFRPISPNPHEVPLKKTKPLDPYFPMPADVAHYVGQGVALVVAESVMLAKDAAERVVVDYEELPATVDTAAAS